ncbi:MAG: ABC transporter substrate-binding protein, partial [Pseudomonadales bacterium]|nr:ABC transporter substrate-binding protein [Pseudomonadales bacterium]
VLDTKIHPFNNFEFRKALSLAIDRDYLLQVSQLSISSNETFETTLPIFANWQGNAQLGEYEYLMKYRPVQAKKILKKAGFIDRNGDGFRENPDGTRLAFHIAISSERTDLVNVLIAVVEDLQDIGINVRIKSAVQTKWASIVKQGNYPAYINGFDNETLGITQVENYIANQVQKKSRPLTSVVAQDSSHPINTLIKQYQLSDTSDQVDILSQIQTLMAKELTAIELFSNARSYQYNDFYFQGWANQNNPFVRPSVQMGYPERVIHVLNLSLKSRPRYLIER